MAVASDDRSAAVRAVMILMLALGWLAFGLRSWVRLVLIKAPGIDDLLTLLALLLFSVYGGFVLYAAHWGTGKHVTALTPEALENALFGWWFCEVFYVLCTAVLKCAVGTFLLRVASQKLHRVIIWTMIGINIVFNIYYVHNSIFQCHPVEYFWTQVTTTRHGHCHATRVAYATYAQSALSILTDWVFGILPIFIVWHLQMSKQKRVGVALVLGLGAIASSATIVRVPYLITLTHTEDFLFATVDVAIWSTVEPGIGIAAVSLATLRPLFRTCLSRAGFSSSNYQRSGSFGYTGRGGSAPTPIPFGKEPTKSGDLMEGNLDGRRFRGDMSGTTFFEDDSFEREGGKGVQLSPMSSRFGTISPATATFSESAGKGDWSTTSLTQVADAHQGEHAISPENRRPPHFSLPRPLHARLSPIKWPEDSEPQNAAISTQMNLGPSRPAEHGGREEEISHLQSRGNAARHMRYDWV